MPLSLLLAISNSHLSVLSLRSQLSRDFYYLEDLQHRENMYISSRTTILSQRRVLAFFMCISTLWFLLCCPGPHRSFSFNSNLIQPENPIQNSTLGFGAIFMAVLPE